MARYGWIVALERAPLLESDTGADAFFTVNLVRPWSDDEKPGEPRGPALDQATEKTGDLWSPWVWTDADDWVVYGEFKNAGGGLTWQKIDTAKVKRPPASKAFKNEAEFVDAIHKEVLAATEKTQYPLSQAMEDHQSKGTRSHVHTLAPLTHWPARLSGGALRLTWLLTDKKTAFEDCNAVVCYPKFTIKPGTLVTDQVQAPKDGTLKAGLDFKTKKSFSIDYADNVVGFLALAADPSLTGGKLPDDGLELSQGAVSRSALQSAFTNNLLPLSVLLAWMDKQAPAAAALDAVQKSLVRALWAALGFGREYVGADGKRPNVVEFLVKNDSIGDTRFLRNAIERGVREVPDTKALTLFADVVKALGEAKTSNEWTQERHSVWADVQRALASLQDGKPKTADEFRADWLAPARLLATEDGQREAMGLWLANVLDPLFLPPPPPPQQGIDEIAAWRPVQEKLLRVGEFRKDLVMRSLPFTASPELWDAARVLARTPDDAAAITTLMQKTLEAVTAALGQPAQLPDGVEDKVKEQVKRFVEELARASDGNRPRPRDRGLKLDFSGWDSSAASGSDHQIRGYAIGLCAGYVASKGSAWKPDTKRAQWLTDTAVLVDHKWATDVGDTIAWMHEAVGATSSNGEKLVSVEYEGAPIATALAVGGAMKYAGDDPDGFKAIDFAWKDDENERQRPLLGYGLYYAAKATPLDNVGAVIDEKLRYEANDGTIYVTELKEASEVLKTLDAPLQYVSSEAPGSPNCSKKIEDAYYELSNETQAHAWQASEIAKAVEAAAGNPDVRVPTLQKVALLGKQQSVTAGGGNVVLFPTAKDKCQFTVMAHGTHWAFIDRWLATDRLLVENAEAPSDTDLGTKADVILAFANTFREKEGPRAGPTAPPYHPAVRAIGVELVVFGKTVAHDFLPIDRVRKDAAGVLQAAKDSLSVDVLATDSGMPRLTVTKPQKQVKLELPRGLFACLRFYALVDEKHFTPGSSDQRYAEDLANTTGIAFAGFRAFSPTQLWFETLPEWPSDGLPQDKVEMNLTPPSETPAGLLSPNLLVAELAFPQVTKWAQWLKGAHIQRHEWHWTGYPVDFPAEKSELPAWIPSLAGVESFREIIDVDFTTSFANTEWRIGLGASGKAVVHRWALAAGARPARYVAYLARPMLRFKRWLNPKLGDAGPQAVEKDIYARGKLVPGRMREGPLERLATPALKHSIPLTAAYSTGLKRGANGVMLVFDDAIRRTDDLARVGGLGDTIEIDLIDTRIAGVAEMGNNPIFHPAEPQPTSGLSTDAAFGLTFDIGPNPKVAQTAIVVRPLNAGGRWVMAMARARRMILPETELATFLHADPKADGVQKHVHLAVVPARLDGKDMVPLDFVLDVRAPLAGPLRLDCEAKDLVVALPKAPDADSNVTYRYLVTWHKARWADGGDPRWRCQVMLQARGVVPLAWNTLPGTVRGFQNAGSELEPGRPIERWWLYVEDSIKEPQVRRIRISDYTDPRWLTFIGSFGNEAPGMARDYRFVMRNGKLDMLELAPGSKAALPQLQNRDASLASADPTFHLALVFRALPDAVRLRTEEGTGELVACYFVDHSKKPIFLPRATGDTEPTNLTGCYAHVLTLQRITSLSLDEMNQLKAKTLPDLLECAFPLQGATARESILRLVPEYLGPVPIIG